jgi:hypothetical protein
VIPGPNSFRRFDKTQLPDSRQTSQRLLGQSLVLATIGRLCAIVLVPIFEVSRSERAPEIFHLTGQDAGVGATFLLLAMKAASIRKRESLSSWLHGAAYRMAMHAKRIDYSSGTGSWPFGVSRAWTMSLDVS